MGPPHPSPADTARLILNLSELGVHGGVGSGSEEEEEEEEGEEEEKSREGRWDIRETKEIWTHM